MLAGKPQDPSWETNTADAAALLRNSAARLSFSHQEKEHRRGLFRVLTLGIFYAMGRLMPGNRTQKNGNVETLGALLRSRPIIRIAGFQNGKFYPAALPL